MPGRLPRRASSVRGRVWFVVLGVAPSCRAWCVCVRLPLRAPVAGLPRAWNGARSRLPTHPRARVWDTATCVGAWRSLVARAVRVGEVPGSNPGAPDWLQKSEPQQTRAREPENTGVRVRRFAPASLPVRCECSAPGSTSTATCSAGSGSATGRFAPALSRQLGFRHDRPPMHLAPSGRLLPRHRQRQPVAASISAMKALTSAAASWTSVGVNFSFSASIL